MLNESNTAKYVFYGIQTLIGLLISILFMWMSSISGNLERLEVENQEQDRHIYPTEEKVNGINEWLNRLEGKIDRTLENYRTRP